MQGDRPGRLLANRVKAFQAKTKISHISSPSGVKIQDPRAIANSFAEFYSKLYNLQDDPSLPVVTDSTVQAFLSKLALPRISPDQLDSINSPITLLELNTVIDHLKIRKSP